MSGENFLASLRRQLFSTRAVFERSPKNASGSFVLCSQKASAERRVVAFRIKSLRRKVGTTVEFVSIRLSLHIVVCSPKVEFSADSVKEAQQVAGQKD